MKETTSEIFECAGANIPGTDHTLPGQPMWKNCQDSYFIKSGGDIVVGLITDGCGSGKQSEIGAQIGAKVFGQKLFALATRNLNQGKSEFTRWAEVKMHTLGVLQSLASQIDDSMTQALNDLLYATVGFLVTPENTYVFHCGDGSYAVNEEITKLGPFENNAPPYLAYALTDGHSTRSYLALTKYKTEDVQSLCVTSDGVDYIKDFQFVLKTWLSEDIVFKNPDVLRRRLAVMNAESAKDGVLRGGPLKDDTSCVILRRKFKL